MKVLFVEARKRKDIDEKKAVGEFLGSNRIKRIGIAASVQYLGLAGDFKREFEKNGVKVYSARGSKTAYESQIIGCDTNAALSANNKVDAFVILSDGKFHAVQLALRTSKRVFVLQGESLGLIGQKEVEAIRKKRNAAVVNFLHSDKVGVIVSTKPGQQKLNEALKIRDKLENKGKKAFLFLADTINICELENFQCKSWINTACPAMILDSNRIVNTEDIKKFLD